MTPLSPARAFLQGLGRRLRALRAFSFPLVVLPVFVAAAAVRPISEWEWPILAVSAACALLLNATGNLFNDYFDYRSGVDRKVDGDESRPGRLLVRGELRPGEVLVEAFVCLALAIAGAAYLIWVRGPGLLWFGAAGVLAAYVYTGPPLYLKYRALGEVLIFITFGPALMAGAAYVHVGSVPLIVLLLSIPVGLVTTAVLLGGNIRDVEEDAQAGIKTLAHVIGGTWVKVAYGLALFAPAPVVGLFVALGIAPTPTLACLLLLLPAFLLARRALGPERTPDVDARTARFALGFMLALGIGLAV